MLYIHSKMQYATHIGVAEIQHQWNWNDSQMIKQKAMVKIRILSWSLHSSASRWFAALWLLTSVREVEFMNWSSTTHCKSSLLEDGLLSHFTKTLISDSKSLIWFIFLNAVLCSLCGISILCRFIHLKNSFLSVFANDLYRVWMHFL